MIFDQNTPNTTINYVEKAIRIINTNVKYGRHRWSTNISIIQVRFNF